MRSLARAWLLAALATLACSTRASVPASAPTPEPSGVLMVGAAKVDITPMPGLPLGAHSIEGGQGLARWTRLSARAIHFEDAKGGHVVLVACDLWSIPAGLGDAVLDRLHRDHDLGFIERSDLLLAATHTHHGPSGFASNRLYNRAAGSAMGFDPRLFDFLAERIALAIAGAFASRVPARIELERNVVGELARNRSLEPFLANPEASTVIERNAELPPCTASEAACRAIDPNLTTLHVRDAAGRTIAVAGFFAVHATTMVNDTDAYNSDLFGVASSLPEQSLAKPGEQPVVALFNGPEGDVSPDWRAQGPAAALELGERLGLALIDVLGDERCGRAIDGEIRNAYLQVDLAHAPVAGTFTARRAMPGKALLGGAEDGPTRYRRRWPEGQTVERQRRAGQGPKRPAIPPALFSLVFPVSTLVASAPVSVHRIGSLAIAGVPGEFTTVMGMRIRKAMREASGEHIDPIVVGLADEYAGYFVTPQEYALQHYEGGSTMWGQYSGQLLAEAVGRLAAPDLAIPQPHRARFDPGMHRDFALRREGPLRGLFDHLAGHFDLAGAPSFTFATDLPSWTSETWPSLSVESRVDDRWIEIDSDAGTNFIVHPLALERERWVWRAYYIGPIPPGELRFLATGLGVRTCSTGFGAGAEAGACADGPRVEPSPGPGLLVR